METLTKPISEVEKEHAKEMSTRQLFEILPETIQLWMPVAGTSDFESFVINKDSELVLNALMQISGNTIRIVNNPRSYTLGVIREIQDSVERLASSSMKEDKLRHALLIIISMAIQGKISRGKKFQAFERDHWNTNINYELLANTLVDAAGISEQHQSAAESLQHITAYISEILPTSFTINLYNKINGIRTFRIPSASEQVQFEIRNLIGVIVEAIAQEKTGGKSAEEHLDEYLGIKGSMRWLYRSNDNIVAIAIMSILTSISMGTVAGNLDFLDFKECEDCEPPKATELLSLLRGLI